MKKTKKKTGSVICASAFWNNDKPGGLGLSYPGACDDFERSVLDAIPEWDKHCTPADCLAQLATFGEVGVSHMSQEYRWIAFVNICWLEMRGHLQPDNFNGAIWGRRMQSEVLT